MKTNLFSYNSILFTLIIILISTITIWKLPKTQNGYTHIGIAVYDMDDTFINDYVTKLQNKIDRSSFSGKKFFTKSLMQKEMPTGRNTSSNICIPKTSMPCLLTL